ncbi:MAG: apolipoprotein N-acyltransferase [bacterium]|nr:apolipoprotein N-acyltransferase [bacterium]
MEKLKTFYRKNSAFLLPIISGVLLFLAYPPQDLWFLVFIGLVPLFYFLFSEKTSFKNAFWGGGITGFIFMGGLFVWLFYTAPFEWLGVKTQKDFVSILLLVIFSWAFTIFCLGLFFALFSWLLKKIIKTHSGFISFLVITPFLWIIFEYLRAWGFEFIWLGKETFFGPHWTFGNLAYALHKIPLLIQSADIWGIYGIGFLVVLINSVLFLFIKSFVDKKRLSTKQIIVSCLIFFIVFSFFIVYGESKMKTETGKEQRRIALMQTNFLSDPSFNPYHKKEVLKIVLDMFQKPESIQENPDFIIMPEGLGIVSATGSTKITKYLLEDFWKKGQIYLENRKVVEENKKNKSRLFYYDLEQENPLGYYEKRLLVANGDFLPYITKFILIAFSYKSDFEKRLYQKGEISTPTTTPKGIVGGTICSSILSPDINREMTKNGAEFLVVVSSDSPFHGSKSLLTQNLAMSRLRAIENRRYFAQATNMGYSFLLDSKGKTASKSQKFGNEILFANIELSNRKTLYTKFGDWFVLLAFIILTIKLGYPQALMFLFKSKK